MLFCGFNVHGKRNQRQLRTGGRRDFRSLRFDTLEERQAALPEPNYAGIPQFGFDSAGTGRVLAATEALQPHCDHLVPYHQRDIFTPAGHRHQTVFHPAHVDSSGNLVVLTGRWPDHRRLGHRQRSPLHGYAVDRQHRGLWLYPGHFGRYSANPIRTPIISASSPRAAAWRPCSAAGRSAALASSERSTFTVLPALRSPAAPREVSAPRSPDRPRRPTRPAVTLGANPVTLTDTAVLSGGQSPTGTITFTLYERQHPGGHGDGHGQRQRHLHTPTGYALPTTGTVTGTYQWDASYSGDATTTRRQRHQRAKRAGDGQPGQPGNHHDAQHHQRDAGHHVR